GSKFGPDIQGVAACELARRARAPVKLMLDRAEEITVAGNRPSAVGRVKIGGTATGTIQAFEVDVYGTPGFQGGATVNFNLLPYPYVLNPQAVRHIKKRVRIVRLNAGVARAMRAPGHPQNCYLTESAVDDMAARLGLNPIDVRLRNLPANLGNAAARSLGSMQHDLYRQQIEIAARLSDWRNRWHSPGRGGDGPIKTGLGMA